MANNASEDTIAREVDCHASPDQTNPGELTVNQQSTSSKWNQTPGNVEDLDEYTAHPHYLPATISMPRDRRTWARRFVAGCLDFAGDLCSAALEQTALQYRKGRREFYHRLTEHRRRKVCRRAEANDVVTTPSRRQEVTERNQVESGLLRLPVELRMQIYELIYTPAATIDISDEPSGTTMFRLHARMAESSLHIPSCHIKETSCPCFVRRVGFNLPLTSRQLYSETIDYLYSTNTFRFAGNRLIFSLPDTVPVKHLQCITSLDLTFELDRIFESFHLLGLLEKRHLPTYLARSETRDCNAYIEFWRFLRTTLTKLQSLVVSLHRMGSSDSDKALEQRFCEWVLAPLFQRAEGGVHSLWNPELRQFEVRLGTFWFLHDDPEDTSFAESYKDRGAPFVLRRECGCGHDFRYCILFHLPD